MKKTGPKPGSGLGSRGKKRTNMTEQSDSGFKDCTQQGRPPNHFSKNGFSYDLIKSSGNVALYAQKKGERVICYEVHKVRWQPERVVNGKVLPAGPKLPGNEDWGKYGWTFCRIENAQAKYDELQGEE